MKSLFESKLKFYIFIFFVGGLATFTVPPFSFFLFIFALGFGIYKISFIKSLKKSFLAGWTLGFGWFLFGLYWIGSAFIVADTFHVYFMPVAVILLPSLLAIFWGVAFFLAKLLTKKQDCSIIMIVILLSLVEYLRAFIFTGFPWLMPSMVLSSNEYFIQTFSFVGSFGGNLIVIALSVLPFIITGNIHYKIVISLFFLIPIFILFILNFLRFNEINLPKLKDQLITIVQPNIEQKDKWNIQKREIHLRKLVELSRQEIEQKNYKNRLIIWPETSFAGVIPNEKSILSSIAKNTLKNAKTKLVIGLLKVNQNKIYNSLVFLNSSGEIIYEYDKLHLVPFGEYIPFRKNFTKIADFFSQQDFTSGTQRPNIDLDGFGEIITLICYEVLFSKEVNSRVTKDTNLLINITNDGWFGKTIGPYQHLALAKIRAVELGLPLVRVANTGISSFISPYGEEIAKIDLNNEGAKTLELLSGLRETNYKKFGDNIFFIFILMLTVLQVIIKNNKRIY
jgi:apolipoprotein N-acyltransferase